MSLLWWMNFTETEANIHAVDSMSWIKHFMPCSYRKTISGSGVMMWSYSYLLGADYFPITTCSEMFPSSYATAILSTTTSFFLDVIYYVVLWNTGFTLGWYLGVNSCSFTSLAFSFSFLLFLLELIRQKKTSWRLFQWRTRETPSLNIK